MVRPALPLGTHGKIRFQRTSAGDAWRARAQVRDWDGVTRPVERTARTKPAAAGKLKIAVRDRVRVDAVEDVGPDTKVAALAETWHHQLVVEGKVAPTSLDQYRRILDRFTIGKLGKLYVKELTAGRLDRHQEAVATAHGPSVAKLNRTVLSGLCGLAVRRGALAMNPVRDLSSTRSGVTKPARSLAVAEARQLLAFLTYDDQAIARDLPDIVAIMLATSVRISECLALEWDAVDLEAGTVEIRSNVVRVKGSGLTINRYESNKLKHRTLRLPTWAVELLRARRDSLPASTFVFPAVRSSGQCKPRDRSNTSADLPDALSVAGVEGITSHVFRKTVATLMDEAGRTARDSADQLGHAKVSITQDRYQGRRVADTGAAAVLEQLWV